MSFEQIVIRILGSGALLVLLGGIVVRGRIHECVSFAVYVVAVVVPQILETLWPDRFYVPNVWLTKEALHQVLKFAVVLELTARTVAAFPSARRAAEGTLLAVLTALVAILLAAFSAPDWTAIVTSLLPKALGGTVWIFCALTFVILWYRLPVTDFGKAILLGFVLYLLSYSLGLALIGTIGWHIRPTVNLVIGIVYLLVEAYWARAAWIRTSREPGSSLT